VVNNLAHSTPAQLKIPSTLVDTALAANASLLASPTLPAWQRYDGVVFAGANITGLSTTEFDLARQRFVVVSGLLGLVGLDDPTPMYRASMDASVAQLGKLSTWWRPTLSTVVGSWRDEVIDLLPLTHRRAIDCPPAFTWTVDLYHGTQRGGHDAKFAKGRFARWLLSHDIRDASRWRDDGWRVAVTPPTP
jgi:cytoplasmic iron level regulating protein YaaA (DUF328/UPF0246 family)